MLMFKWIKKIKPGSYWSSTKKRKVVYWTLIGALIFCIIGFLFVGVIAFCNLGLTPTKNLFAGIKNFAVDKFSGEKSQEQVATLVVPQAMPQNDTDKQWKKGFVSAQAILDQAKKYTDQEIKKLPKAKTAQKSVAGQVPRLEKKLLDIEMQLAILTPKVVPKVKIEVKEKEKEKTIIAEQKKAVEVRIQQPVSEAMPSQNATVGEVEKNAISVLAEAEKVLGKTKTEQPAEQKPQTCVETAEQKIKRLEQEKAQIELLLKDSECQVRTLQEKDIASVSEKEKDKKCKPTRFLVGGRFYR